MQAYKVHPPPPLPERIQTVFSGDVDLEKDGRITQLKSLGVPTVHLASSISVLEIAFLHPHCLAMNLRSGT